MTTPILFASWYTGLGGGETDLLTLADGLDPATFMPHLLIPRAGQLGDVWQSRGWPVHQVAFRGATTWFVPALWAQFPVVNRLHDLIRQQQIALVHSDYHTLPLIAPAAERAGSPVMWTVHGWWFRPKPWQKHFMRRWPAVARSKAIRDGFLGDPPFMPLDRLPVIYSGVDVRRFNPTADGAGLRAELNIAQDTPIVAMVARFQPVKGHDTFQDMARKVADAVPDVRFIVAGEDTFGVTADETYKRDILARAANDPILRDRLQYIGFRDDVERVYQAADVVVCASDFESYGKANQEAMACGTPVVSTNQGGPAETVIDGQTGYLVPPRDPSALAFPVIRLLGDDALRATMGSAARAHVMENFSADTANAAYVQHFRKLIAGKGSATE